LASSTHDSKRSEDVRARINVLSEIPELWSLRVRNWKRSNRSYKQTVNDKPAPSPNDEYLIYQTLVGAWPVEPMQDGKDWETFRSRIDNYILKAMREAKQNTSWINQNKDYEDAVSAFVGELLRPGADNRFLRDFAPFQKRIARVALWNGLSQTLLKLASPGVPDIYQGTELWDLSLVDPDNRRPVDYSHRRKLFDGMREWGNAPEPGNLRTLLDGPEDGRLKMYVISKTLCLRRRLAQLFEQGEYLPMDVEGDKADHVVAFARKLASTALIVVVPRLIGGLLGEIDAPPIGTVWGDTRIAMPDPGRWGKMRNIFTGEVLALDKNNSLQSFDVASTLSRFPVALCVLD
jgi:(1->4)-alpha-D-glucan 1-alpha-D-glucosylmutase